MNSRQQNLAHLARSKKVWRFRQIFLAAFSEYMNFTGLDFCKKYFKKTNLEDGGCFWITEGSATEAAEAAVAFLATALALSLFMILYTNLRLFDLSSYMIEGSWIPLLSLSIFAIWVTWWDCNCWNVMKSLPLCTSWIGNLVVPIRFGSDALMILDGIFEWTINTGWEFDECADA